jgi:hypothetical protein
MNDWKSVKEHIPESGRTVLACYIPVNISGNDESILEKKQIMIARWIVKFTEEMNPESGDAEYNRETDKFYAKPGWYEQIINMGDTVYIITYNVIITHWMYIPDLP